MQTLDRPTGSRRSGRFTVAWRQFLGSTFLSAILDNNVVADFASRALTDLDLSLLHLFAMAQIAGYALGGCWTHIGCAQSVVAYAFIQRDLDEHYTPMQWIREMTPVIVEMLASSRCSSARRAGFSNGWAEGHAVAFFFGRAC